MHDVQNRWEAKRRERQFTESRAWDTTPDVLEF